MKIIGVVAAVLPFLFGCKLNSGTVGSSETNPLVRVDGAILPVTISDANGTTVSIASGTLTAYDTRATCDYVITLSSGKKVSGQASCLSALATPILNGVQLRLDIGESGVPTGTHNYDFVGAVKPCDCPKFCPCGANRLTPSARALSEPAPAIRLRAYRLGLKRR